jgi:hypothetical protein
MASVGVAQLTHGFSLKLAKLALLTEVFVTFVAGDSVAVAKSYHWYCMRGQCETEIARDPTNMGDLVHDMLMLTLGEHDVMSYQ